jgi:hypothetical protein
LVDELKPSHVPGKGPLSGSFFCCLRDDLVGDFGEVGGDFSTPLFAIPA